MFSGEGFGPPQQLDAMGIVLAAGVDGVQQESAGLVPGATVPDLATSPYLSRTASLIFSFSPVSIFLSFDFMIRKLSKFIVKKKAACPY
jgi:hypothetical protein